MAFLRIRAAALLALAVLACGCKQKSVVHTNASVKQTIASFEELQRRAVPPGIKLPETGPPHLDTVPSEMRPRSPRGPLYLEKLPPSARPPRGVPEAPREPS